MLRQKIAEKGLVELKEYHKKKEAPESAEKALLEAKGKVNRKEKEKCESLEQNLRENKHNIDEIESKIDELYLELNKIIKETKNLINNIKAHEEDYKKSQADLEAKRTDKEGIESKLMQIRININEQKKHYQGLRSYYEAVLTLKNSDSNMTSQELEKSLHAVFNPTRFSLKGYSELKKLKQLYEERRSLSKEISDLNQKVQETSGRSLGNEDDQVWEHIDARKQFLEEKRDDLVTQMGKLLGNRPLSGENRLTPRNAKEYSQKWDNLQPITHPQTSESFDLRDQEYVKASQTFLDRLAKVPGGSSQSIFWMRYGEIINRTIKVYENPQPEEAKEQLMKALETLDKANKIVNAFLDLMYGKEQKASSSQEQA